MSRGFLASVMLISLLVTGVGASMVYMTLKDKSMVVVPLTPVPAAAPVIESSISTATAVTPETSQTTPAAEPVPAAKEVPSGPQNVLLTYKNPLARNVAIIGEFNDWRRTSYKKVKAGEWQITLKLEPGEYRYLLVVDDRRIKDPGNELISKDLKSVLRVKSPSAAQ